MNVRRYEGMHKIIISVIHCFDFPTNVSINLSKKRKQTVQVVGLEWLRMVKNDTSTIPPY